MKVKWGAFMTDGRNKIGGQVASKNRAGAYMRTKVTPVNPATVAQSVIKSRLTVIAQAWRGLTQAQRNSWNSAVATFAKTDIFGDLRNPSGFNLFQRLNNNIIALGGVLTSTLPLVEGLDQYSDLVLTHAVGVPALSLAFTAIAGADSGYKLFATAPQSAGKSFVKSEYRIISQVDAAAVSPFNILAAYTAVFGGLGAVGSKIFVKLVPVGAVSGLEGTEVATSAIAAA